MLVRQCGRLDYKIKKKGGEKVEKVEEMKGGGNCSAQRFANFARRDRRDHVPRRELFYFCKHSFRVLLEIDSCLSRNYLCKFK